MVVNATGVVARRAPRGDRGRSSTSPTCRISAAAGAFGAPQHRLHAGDELGRRERLGHVVVGAELEPEHAVDLAVAGGEEDHRDGRRLAEPAAHLEAVDVGETDVEHDEAGPVRRRPPRTPSSPVAAFTTRKPSRREVELDQVGDVGLVVDDEDGPALHMPSIVASERRMNVSFV